MTKNESTKEELELLKQAKDTKKMKQVSLSYNLYIGKISNLSALEKVLRKLLAVELVPNFSLILLQLSTKKGL